MPKPNYGFEKRQRELAKKKKQDEKDARKREARNAALPSEPGSEPAPVTATTPATGPVEPAPRIHRRPASDESTSG